MQQDSNRTVRISGRIDRVTFTQRGKRRSQGFIRMNGLTISGDRYEVFGEQLFYPDPLGVNSNVPYEAL